MDILIFLIYFIYFAIYRITKYEPKFRYEQNECDEFLYATDFHAGNSSWPSICKWSYSKIIGRQKWKVRCSDIWILFQRYGDWVSKTVRLVRKITNASNFWRHAVTEKCLCINDKRSLISASTSYRYSNSKIVSNCKKKPAILCLIMSNILTQSYRHFINLLSKNCSYKLVFS